MRLETVIASSHSLKMLLTLAKVKKTHVNQLVRMSNSTYSEVHRNLVIPERARATFVITVLVAVFIVTRVSSAEPIILLLPQSISRQESD